MKIFGFTYVDGRAEVLLKGDSALLPNRKPFFLPDDTSIIAAHPVCVFRISRLGKNIAPRFAHRYVDAYAAGLHIEDHTSLQALRSAGRPWTTAVAMDGSLPVGTFLPMAEGQKPHPIAFTCAGTGLTLEADQLLLPLEEAIAEVSRFITIKQGDYLFLPMVDTLPFFPHEEDYVTATIAGEENFFCKIK